MNIELLKRYSKKEIAVILDFTDAQLKTAEHRKYLVFFDGGMYGIYLFQFLKTYSKQLEEIKNAD